MDTMDLIFALVGMFWVVIAILLAYEVFGVPWWLSSLTGAIAGWAVTMLTALAAAAIDRRRRK